MITMIKPFSALKFFKENKRKGLMTFVVLILSICAVSLITVLINSIHESYNDTVLKPFANYSIVGNTSHDIYLNQSVVDRLKSDSNIERLVPCDIDATNVSFSIGGGLTYGVFADKSDIGYYLDKVNDTVEQGRLPENNSKEIAVHRRVMSNKNWEIGQTVGNEKNSDEMLSGAFKIVGILDGPSITFVGTQTNRQGQYVKNELDTTKPINYAVFPKAGKMGAVNEMLDKINVNDASVTTYSILKSQGEESFASIDNTLIAIILAVTIILSISISALMYLIYLQRSDEFGILLAMGYRKSFIYRLIFKEVLALNIISWSVGLLASYLVIQLLNFLIYNPQGSMLNLFSANVFENTIYIPVAAVLFSVLPILSKMRKQDPITIIEGRN